MMNNIREEFEEWADNEGIDLESKGGFHELAAINTWAAWQAAYQAGRAATKEGDINKLSQEFKNIQTSKYGMAMEQPTTKEGD